MFKLPRLPSGLQIADPKGWATILFAQFWQQVAAAIENAVNGIQQALEAANIALTAADTAQSAAADAQAAADAAASGGAANAFEQALQQSGIVPTSVLTATPTDITIAPHDRVYGDGTTVSVLGATIPAGGTPGADSAYVYYDDPTRTGGAVTFVATLTPPIQGNNRHVVGAVAIPSAGSQGGGQGPRFPGQVEPL